MKKPVKNIYYIDATNGHVFVRHIAEDYYEANRHSPASWAVVREQATDDKKFPVGSWIYRNFGTGAAAEQYIVAEKAKYEIDKTAYDEFTAEERARAAIANDNYEKLIHDEKVWREQNMNGKVYK